MTRKHGTHSVQLKGCKLHNAILECSSHKQEYKTGIRGVSWPYVFTISTPHRTVQTRNVLTIPYLLLQNVHLFTPHMSLYSTRGDISQLSIGSEFLTLKLYLGSLSWRITNLQHEVATNGLLHQGNSDLISLSSMNSCRIGLKTLVFVGQDIRLPTPQK